MIHCHLRRWIKPSFVCIRPCHTFSTIFIIRTHSCTDIIAYLNRKKERMNFRCEKRYTPWKFVEFVAMLLLCFCLPACRPVCHASPLVTTILAFNFFSSFSFVKIFLSFSHFSLHLFCCCCCFLIQYALNSCNILIESIQNSNQKQKISNKILNWQTHTQITVMHTHFHWLNAHYSFLELRKSN